MYNPALGDLIDIPFVEDGRDKTGLDCWGLTLEVFRRFGVELPDYRVCLEGLSMEAIDRAIEQEQGNWTRVENPQRERPPLLVVIKNEENPLFCTHTGTYLGYGKFIHTIRKTGSRIERLDHPLWKKRIEGIYKWNGI